jgi:hypothetical protein
VGEDSKPVCAADRIGILSYISAILSHNKDSELQKRRIEPILEGLLGNCKHDEGSSVAA